AAATRRARPRTTCAPRSRPWRGTTWARRWRARGGARRSARPARRVGGCSSSRRRRLAGAARGPPPRRAPARRARASRRGEARGSGAWSAAVGEAALASRVLDHVGALLALVEAVRGAPAGADADAAPRVTSMARVAALLYYSGRYALADALLEEIAPLLPRVAEDPGIEALVTYTRGIRAAFTGDLEAAPAPPDAPPAPYHPPG